MSGPSPSPPSPPASPSAIGRSAVLVGGRSRRFGRDKLREPWAGSEGGTWLVDQPRLALARATGGPVWAVGDCDPDVAARFDGHLPDEHPGAGPLGGIVAGLRGASRILVLSGDLPMISARAVEAILAAAREAPEAEAVLACDAHGEPEPCIGLYRAAALRVLGTVPLAGKTPSLLNLLRELSLRTVPLPETELRNINELTDLERIRHGPPEDRHHRDRA